MSEHTEQQQGFVDAHVNAERLYNLQADQSKAVLASVASMQIVVTSTATDVAVIKVQTEGLPARVQSLENLRFKLMAFVAAVLFLLWAVQTLMWVHHAGVEIPKLPIPTTTGQIQSAHNKPPAPQLAQK
jgi:hypothetical protein